MSRRRGGPWCFHPLLSHNWPRSRTNPIVHRSLLLRIPSGEMRMCRARNFTVSCTRTILCVVFFLSAPCVGTFLRKHILLVSPPMPRASRLCSQMSAIDVFNVDESSSPVGSYIRLSVRKVWQFVRNRFAFCFSLLGRGCPATSVFPFDLPFSFSFLSFKIVKLADLTEWIAKVRTGRREKKLPALWLLLLSAYIIANVSVSPAADIVGVTLVIWVLKVA